MLVPKTLNEAFGLAKIQEEYVNSSRKGFRGVIDNGKASILGTPKLEAKVEPRTKVPSQRLTNAQMEERRKKGLCYNCDEKWQMGHKCRGAKLFLLEKISMEVEPRASSVQLVEISNEEVLLEPQGAFQRSGVGKDGFDLAKITLYALVGCSSSKTMRVRGRIKKQEVASIIDSGSTHNFLDASVLPRLQLQLDTSRVLEVKVVDGTIIKTLGSCPRVTITIQGYQLLINFNVLHLGGCEVVLNTQWLTTLGEISWDFQLLTMKFMYLGKRVFLQGLQTASSTISEAAEANRFLSGSERKGLVLHISTSPIVVTALAQSQLLDVLAALLVEFSKVFVVPTGLPPVSHEHGIILKKGSQPICERPYRYPYCQKSKIEKIVNELLELGYIQPSQSPFSSPVLLVKKVDGSWRMCIDYRALNKATIEDKFPIAVVDEFLDELADAFHWDDKALAAFTKLKVAVTQPPVLSLPDFSKPFVIECDAFGCGLEAALKGKNLHLSTYETELLALATTVKKWRSYLLGRPFVVRTDHQSLKILLEQRIATPSQQKWLAKLLGLQGTNLAISSAYHPQSDGQTEILNMCLEQYLKVFTTSFLTSLKLSPFKALYGFPAPKLQAYILDIPRVDALDSLLCQRQVFLDTLKTHLVATQARMKFQADKNRQDRSFEVRDWVFLRLQTYRQQSLASKGRWKLSPMYFGLFQVLQKIGPVSYKLDLQPESKVLSELIAVLKTRTKALRSRVITEVWFNGWAFQLLKLLGNPCISCNLPSSPCGQGALNGRGNIRNFICTCVVQHCSV
ncbi:uncharacterized protein LOC142617069 [Castanea sativa]|uniref:uncharacterized protein LOC142617069 n=1 Tax=Castanea sativa TaxID=21020 RepID=UPI003F64C6D7